METKLVFPLWFVIFSPPLVYIVLLGNLFISGLVVYITLRINKIKLYLNQVLTIALKVWLFGFFADVIGANLLLIIDGIFSLQEYTIWNSFTTVVVFSLIILFVGLMISISCYSVCLKLNIPKQVCTRLAISISILTAPWFFLIPSPTTG